MTLTPTVEITAFGRITPGNALTGPTDTYRLGWSGKTLTIPAGCNQIFTRDIDLNAGQELDLSLYTMLLEGGSAQLNPDEVALALTKIFFFALEFYSASDSVVKVSVSAANAGTGQDWTAYPTLRFDLEGVGAMAMFHAPAAGGYPVVSGDNIAIAAGAGAGTIKCKLLVMGYQA